MTEESGYDFKVEALLRCQKCKREMRLFGVEPLTETRELYTFDCDQCGHLEVRGVRIR